MSVLEFTTHTKTKSVFKHSHSENLHSHNKTDLRKVKKEMKREKQRKRYIKDFSATANQQIS